MSTSEVGQSAVSQDAIDKLRVIPVFTIAKTVSELYTSEQDGITVIPLYLSKKAADEALSAYSKAIPDFTASVVYFTLDKMYKIIETFQAEYRKQSKTLVFPIVVRQENTQKAYDILKAEGYGDQQIHDNLTVPVFYSEPMITIESSEGTGSKQVFFLDITSLEEAFEKLPSSVESPSIKVANLSEVLDKISISPNIQDFEFYPTKEFLSLKTIHEAQLKLDSGS